MIQHAKLVIIERFQQIEIAVDASKVRLAPDFQCFNRQSMLGDLFEELVHCHIHSSDDCDSKRLAFNILLECEWRQAAACKGLENEYAEKRFGDEYGRYKA